MTDKTRDQLNCSPMSCKLPARMDAARTIPLMTIILCRFQLDWRENKPVPEKRTDNNRIVREAGRKSIFYMRSGNVARRRAFPFLRFRTRTSNSFCRRLNSLSTEMASGRELIKNSSDENVTLVAIRATAS